MKKSFLLSLSAATLLFSAATGLAADKEVTISGEGCCAKCSLKEAKECQNAIVVEEGGKKTTYLLVQNDKSKGFHKEVCQATKKVKAKGTVKEVNGKHELTISEIEVVKK